MLPDEKELERPVLSYRSPREPGAPPHPVEPILMCAPGLLCWLMLGLVVFFDVLFPAELFWITLLLAVITAIASVVRYGRRPQWWSVWVVANLTLNIIGLLFTAFVFAMVA